MRVKVSIIVPIYNAHDHISQCLDHLLSQDLKEIEIICVLDCPTDGTDEIVKAYAEKDERITIIENKNNLHVGESRNVGLSCAKGEFIGFCDHDDYCDTTMYKELYECAISNHSLYSYCDYSVIVTSDKGKDISRHKRFETNPIQCLESILKDEHDLHTIIWNKIIKKEFIIQNNIKFKDTKKINGEDQLFNCEILLALYKENEKACYIEKKMYHHLIHKNNTGLSDSYIEKSILFRDYLTKKISTSYVNKHTKTEELLTEGTIAVIYRIFRYRLKFKGIKKAISTLTGLHEYKYIIENIRKYKFQYNKNLTIPKNITSWIIKLYLTIKK
ncbi:MAG: glycosyltransferase [Paludibacteraceae bacterium]|nr:glycosyltransferase [Paludibacteraceae bacterium]MBR6105359.1 glycosyltransferase [Paludibacteraceae bacterium]